MSDELVDHVTSLRQALDVKDALFLAAVTERDAALLALRVIRRLASGPTPGNSLDDLVVVGNVADQALHGRTIVGYPAIYDIDVIVEREAMRASR